jgi:hypothetical protein
VFFVSRGGKVVVAVCDERVVEVRATRSHHIKAARSRGSGRSRLALDITEDGGREYISRGGGWCSSRITDWASRAGRGSVTSLTSGGRQRGWYRLFERRLAVLVLCGSIGDGSSGLPGSCARRSDPTAGCLDSL